MTMVNFPDDGNTGPHTIGLDAFATIQAGVNASIAGGTLKVAAGTYPELVHVTVPITMKGANAGIDPRTSCNGGATRGAESIIDGHGTETAIEFDTSGITLDGFIIQGGTADAAHSGVDLHNGFDNNKVLNNIITKNSIGVFANCAGPLPTVIQKNRIDSNNTQCTPTACASEGAGIYVDKSVNLQILDNEITGHTVNNPLLIAATGAGSHTNLIVTGNNIHDNACGCSAIYALGITNGTFSKNTISSDGTGLRLGSADNGIQVQNNAFVRASVGVRLIDDGFNFPANKDVHINGNSFDLANVTTAVSRDAGNNGSDSDTVLDASANWWGVSSSATVPTRLDTTDGAIDYTPWLISGSDIDSDACDGFQGDFSTLIVDAASMQSGSTGRIQEGVNLVSGSTVIVEAGTYNENVVINKSLLLQGANAGVDPRLNCRLGPARGAESIVDGGGNDATIALLADNITVDGFTVEGGAFGSYNGGLYMSGGVQNDHILNNIITANTMGIAAACGAASSIRTNLITANNQQTGPSFGNGIDGYTTNIDLTISDNEFTDHNVGNPILLEATAANQHIRIAIVRNNFHNNINASAIYCLGITNGTVSQNQIAAASDVTCLSFSGGNNTVAVNNNFFSGGARGIRVETGGFALPGLDSNSDIHINSNSFVGFTFSAGLNYAVGNESSFTGPLDASANWWGANTEAGVTGVIDVTGGTVDYTPWLDTGIEPVINVCDGFEGDFGTLWVSAASPQTGATGRIQEGINLAGTRVNILSGAYTESPDATAKTVTLSPGASPAQVTINGDLTLGSSDTLAVELNGTTTGTGYDQLVVNGAVTLGGATLSATATPLPDCASLTIIDNDLADPVSGTFDGLTNGALVTISGQDFKIFYNKGTGNDVVLVKDTTLPSISCPTNVTVQCFSNVPPPAADFAGFIAQGGAASDNCGTVTVRRCEKIACH